MLIALILMILGQNGQIRAADPAGTWGVYHGDAEYPKYVLVITPIKGGWATSWADGNRKWLGVMHRGRGPNTFVEHWWQDVQEENWPGRGNLLWVWQDGGAICEGSTLNLRKQ